MSDEGTCLVDLPSPILSDIFSRLPPTTIIHVKTVCKSFLNITLESHFPKHPTSIIIHQFFSWTSDNRNTIKLLKFTDNHEICHDPNGDLDLEYHFPEYSFSLIGSVHGIVCINNFSGNTDTISILNPTTKEYITLPKAKGVRKYPNLVNYGFGFDPITLEYKVVRIYLEKSSSRDDSFACKSEGQVYTIGKEGCWRSAGHVMYDFGCRLYGVNLHGKIHWLVWDGHGNEFICFLDLVNESFETFPTAPAPYPQENCPVLRSLGVFGRCLCLCDNNVAGNEFVVWVMKEYGVMSSWMKEIVIDVNPELDNSRLCYEMIYLLRVLDDGEVLFLWRDDFLFLHHPVKKTLKVFDKIDGNFLACWHISSYFSLKSFEAEVVNQL